MVDHSSAQTGKVLAALVALAGSIPAARGWIGKSL
jgi:hypothetical protein